MNVKRIGAVFVKELQDARTNWSQLLLYVLPIAISLIYGKLIPADQMPQGTALVMGLAMLVTTAGIFIPAMMIAEEKEKRTLEVLLLSPAKPHEIFLGKSLTTFMSIIVCTFVLMAIDSRNWDHLPIILATTCLVSVFCILFGLITGIFSKSQSSTGVVGTPLMFLFFMLPTFAVLGIKELAGVALAMPTYHYIIALKTVVIDGGGKTLNQCSILALSIPVASAILFAVCRKKGLE